MTKKERIRILENKMEKLIEYLDIRPVNLLELADRQGVPLGMLNPFEFSHFEKIVRCKKCGKKLDKS